VRDRRTSAHPTEDTMPSDDLLPFGARPPGWLFRGTDAAWDVLTAAIAADPSAAAPWPIAPSGPSMAPGERVLLWRSGRGGGIAAACTVLDEPIAAVGDDGRPHVTVDIRVDRAFERPLPPALLLTRDELRPLAFLDLLEATEHRITERQASALAELITRDVDDLDGSEHDAMTTVEVPVRLAPIVMELLAGLGASDPSGTAGAATTPPTDLQVAQAEVAARRHGMEPFTVDEVAATWRTGVGTARSRIERLLDAGLIERAGTRTIVQPGTSRPARGRPPVLYRLRSPLPVEH
jgi:hypothetical protein